MDHELHHPHLKWSHGNSSSGLGFKESIGHATIVDPGRQTGERGEYETLPLIHPISQIRRREKKGYDWQISICKSLKEENVGGSGKMLARA